MAEEIGHTKFLNISGRSEMRTRRRIVCRENQWVSKPAHRLFYSVCAYKRSWTLKSAYPIVDVYVKPLYPCLEWWMQGQRKRSQCCGLWGDQFQRGKLRANVIFRWKRGLRRLLSNLWFSSDERLRYDSSGRPAGRMFAWHKMGWSWVFSWRSSLNAWRWHPYKYTDALCGLGGRAALAQQLLAEKQQRWLHMQNFNQVCQGTLEKKLI